MFVEIKGSSSVENITKAEEQLAKTSSFMFNLIQTLQGQVFNQSTSPSFNDIVSILPAIKVIVFPSERGTFVKTNACYHLFKSSLDDIKNTWTTILEDLEQHLPSCSGKYNTDSGFQDLVSLLAGMWPLKSMKHSSSSYEERQFQHAKASCAHLVTQTDEMIDEVRITSDLIKSLRTGKGKKAKNYNESRLSNTGHKLHFNPTGTVFRNKIGYNLFYFTPQQKFLFDKVKQCFVHAGAGTGKTLHGRN